MSIRDMLPYVVEADRRGFEIAFFSETLSLMRDSVSAVAVFAAHTERIGLGFTQIVRLRTPVVMSQTVLTLAELAGPGRITVAPGACTDAHAARHGLPPLDPAETLTEWVAAMRELMARESVTFDGVHTSFADVSFGWTPPRERLPFWIAATSPKGLRLAARLGDGVLLNAVSSPAYTANAVAILRREVEGAGRSWDDFDVAQLINCSIADDHQTALDEVRWEVASKFTPWQAPFNARPRLWVGEPSIEEARLPQLEAAYEDKGMEGLMSAVPDAWVEGLTATGDANEVHQRLEAYREAGVKLPILRPATSAQAPRLLEQCAPAAA